MYLGYEATIFFRKQKLFCSSEKNFDGKPKMTKKIGFENLEIPKMGQI